MANNKKSEWQELKKDKVFDAITDGDEVIACNFGAKQIIDCKDLTVGALSARIADSDSLFFTKEVTDE